MCSAGQGMARCRAPGHLLHLTIKRITSHAPHVDHPFCILRHIGAQELSDVPCCQQDDLKRHLNGMRDKIAFYRSEKQKVTHILDVMGVSLQQVSLSTYTTYNVTLCRPLRMLLPLYQWQHKGTHPLRYQCTCRCAAHFACLC